MNSISEQVAEILLTINAVTLNPKKPFKYSSGILSPVYTDCRVLISFPKERIQIRDLYIETLKEHGEFNLIAGTATAGIPHASWIAEKMELPMVYIRGKAKEHGKGNQIEGITTKGQTAAVIEDLISTGGSSIESIKALRAVGVLANHVFAITTYGMEKAAQNYANEKIHLISMTNFEVIVKKAIELDKIKQTEEKTVLEWITDPINWGKNRGFE